MRAWRSPSARARRSTCAGPRRDLGSRLDAVGRLEVDQDVGAAEAFADRVLKLVRCGVCVLEGRALVELHVQVDVAPRTGAAGAEFVEPGDAARAERGDRFA